MNKLTVIRVVHSTDIIIAQVKSFVKCFFKFFLKNLKKVSKVIYQLQKYR